jgi:hypothetical protein
VGEGGRERGRKEGEGGRESRRKEGEGEKERRREKEGERRNKTFPMRASDSSFWILFCSKISKFLDSDLRKFSSNSAKDFFKISKSEEIFWWLS